MHHLTYTAGGCMLSRLFRAIFRSPKQPRFVSELDTFLAQVRTKLPLSASQKQEIAKNDAIAYRRDHKVKSEDNPIWRDF